MGGQTANRKDEQLKQHIKEADPKSRITSDYGVKQSNTDDWLRVTREDQIGPMLLEDPFGREKVCDIRPDTTVLWRVKKSRDSNRIATAHAKLI